MKKKKIKNPTDPLFSFRCPRSLLNRIEERMAITGETKGQVVIKCLASHLNPKDDFEGDDSEWTEEMIDDYRAICNWDDRQDQNRQLQKTDEQVTRRREEI